MTSSVSGPGSPERVGAIVVAAGAGRRFGVNGPPKQYRLLGGEPILRWALRPFLESVRVEQVVVVLPPDDASSPPPWLGELPVIWVAGGAQRSDSVRNGLAALDDTIGTVLVHDGARPLVSRDLLDRVIEAALNAPEEAVIPVIPIADTVKEVDGGASGHVVRTVPRERLWRVQTPQAFPAATLRRVHAEAAAAGFAPSDDAGLFERYGLPVRAVAGDPVNLKVTTETDLIVAEALARRLPGEG